MKWRRLLRAILATLAGVTIIAVGGWHLFTDSSHRPICHKQLYFALQAWIEDARSSGAFPNVAGKSRETLDLIRREMLWPEDLSQTYNYVPGLRVDDPGDLVLLYVNAPTRWIWHGSTPTIFRDRAWLVVPVDFRLGNKNPISRPSPMGQGELSERVSEVEFRRRLRNTLDFVRTNERPNWREVVSEHTQFVNAPEK